MQEARVPAPLARPQPSLRAWASAAGNQAVAAMVARTAADGSHGSPGVPESDFDPANATDDERLAEIRRRLAEGGWLTEVWRTFDDLRAVANANAALWTASVQREPDLAHDEAVLEAFRERVEALATEHLGENYDLVAAEIDALGVASEEQGERDPEHLAAVAQLQALADEVNRALQLKTVLLQLPVGYRERAAGRFDAADPQGRQDEAQVALFDPAGPPSRIAGPGEPGFAAYADVAKQYAEVERVLARGMAHPAIFGLVEQAGGPTSQDAHAALRGFATDHAGVAQANITGTLWKLLRGISKAGEQIGASIDFRDLRPVHAQALAAPPFSGAYERSIAEAAVKDHDDMKTLLAFGLGALQVIAVLAAPLTGGGAAVLIPAVGVGALGASFSYADYERLKSARQARTGATENDLVGEDQVDAAELAAILDAVFVFVDGVQGFADAAKSARLGARAAAATAEELGQKLPALATLATAEREPVLTKAMATLGPGPAIDKAGGMDAIHAAVGGTPAAARADAFAHGIEERLAQHLAEDPADQVLVPRASAFVAAQAQVPAARALPSILPRRATRETLAELVARAAHQLAPEWAGKTPAAREALVQVAIRDQAAALGLPVPWLRPDTGASMGGAAFDSTRWSVLINPATFTDETVTTYRLNEIFVSVRHELQHAHQWITAGRYAQFHAGDTTFHAHLPANIKQAIGAKGPLGIGSSEWAEAGKWYDELGPNRATSNAIQAALMPLSRELQTLRGQAEAAHARWLQAKAALASATTDAEQAQAAQELRIAYEAAARDGAALEAKLKEWHRAYSDYRNLPTERDAFGTEDQFRAHTHQRWFDEAKAETDREMWKLVGLGVLVFAGGTVAGSYAAYAVAPPGRSPAPARRPELSTTP